MELCWIWREKGGVGFWEVEPFRSAGASAVFSSRRGGVSTGPFATLNLALHVGDSLAAVEENRRRFAEAAGFDPRRVATAHQVHGAEVVLASVPGLAEKPADALATSAVRLVLSILVADCVPVYLLDPVTPAVALVHAGWRGTAAGVVTAAVRFMRHAFGSHPQDLLAALGPSIGPCCYEVDEPVMARFAPAFLRPSRPGHALLDLWAANRQQLEEAGVPTGHVFTAGICTACRPDLLYSYRVAGPRTGRMAAAIWLEAR